MLSDKKHKNEPKKIAWLQCVGSRDENRCNNGYCSSVCCMYAAKQSVMAKDYSKVPLDCAVFYMDMRTQGKDFDCYLENAKENGVRFVRSRVHSVYPDRAKENGARFIVADPRNIQLTKFADLSVHQRLGTDVALLNGMMHVIIKNNWHAADYVEKRYEEFEALKETVSSYTPERVAAITGIAAQDIEQMDELYAANAPGALLYAMGITQHTTGGDNVKSCCNLAMLCGNLGVPGGGVNPLRGQNNVQGACDMGGLPNVFTGYQPVADPEVREKFAKAWGCDALSDTPGMTITNTERRCMLTQKAVEPVGNALPDWRIISRFVTALGHDMYYNSPEEIFNEMASLTKSYRGMTYDRIGIDGLQWPCLSTDHPGTPYLHKGTFTRGKGRFHAIEFKEPAEAASAEYPMMMTTAGCLPTSTLAP